MLETNDLNLVIDPKDQRPVAVFIDSFASALGESVEAETIILRLYHKDWPREGKALPPQQVHQFALNVPRAIELANQLLAMTAQVEKDGGVDQH